MPFNARGVKVGRYREPTTNRRYPRSGTCWLGFKDYKCKQQTLLLVSSIRPPNIATFSSLPASCHPPSGQIKPPLSTRCDVPTESRGLADMDPRRDRQSGSLFDTIPDELLSRIITIGAEYHAGDTGKIEDFIAMPTLDDFAPVPSRFTAVASLVCWRWYWITRARGNAHLWEITAALDFDRSSLDGGFELTAYNWRLSVSNGCDIHAAILGGPHHLSRSISGCAPLHCCGLFHP